MIALWFWEERNQPCITLFGAQRHYEFATKRHRYPTTCSLEFYYRFSQTEWDDRNNAA